MAKNPSMTLALIIVLVVGLIALIVIGAVMGPDLLRHFRNQHILKAGIPATAVIKAVEDTGNRYNNNPQVKLTLEVTPENGKPYQAEVVTVISVVAVSTLKPGATVHVKYDPEQPTHVTLTTQ